MPRNPRKPNIRESQAKPDTGFHCHHCFRPVFLTADGTRHRNHCPYCLWSLHVDQVPGDRQASCDGLMEPVAVWVRQKGEWALVHRCQKCGHFKSNRLAGDDNQVALLSIAVRPLAQPPFPLHAGLQTD